MNIMTKEQEDEIYDILSSRSWLWVIPKKPSCLLDEVEIKMVENPEWAWRALKQIQINDNEDFWRSVWTRNKKIK